MGNLNWLFRHHCCCWCDEIDDVTTLWTMNENRISLTHTHTNEKNEKNNDSNVSVYLNDQNLFQRKNFIFLCFKNFKIWQKKLMWMKKNRKQIDRNFFSQCVWESGNYFFYYHFNTLVKLLSFFFSLFETFIKRSNNNNNKLEKLLLSTKKKIFSRKLFFFWSIRNRRKNVGSI